MNENLLKRVKGKLNAKFYVMNDTWLRDCVEFFVRDKSHEMTDRHIFEFVEGQWQLSDLREISNENGCLPKNLVQQVRTVLTGTYILQVDKMYDIASSKYKQLCEFRKISNENLEVREEGKPIEWEPKARRMIQLCLTDGVQDVTAIEYFPLRQMTGTLLPGYKVMIIGPIDCRRGIILLEDGKYKEVGGEVESLLKPNALENVLARALGEPENPDPYNDNGTSRVMNQNAQNATSTPNNNDSFFNDDFEQAVDLEEVTAIERRSQEIEIVQDRFENTRDGRQTLEEETGETMEEFLEDIDFEPLDNWPSDPPTRSLRVSPIENKKFNQEFDIMIIEEASTSAQADSRSKPLHPANSKNESASEFPDDDFDFDDCEIIVKTKESRSQQQSENSLSNKKGTCPSSLMPKPRLTNDILEVKKRISTEVSKTQNNKSMTKTIPNFFAPSPAPKICDVLSDVLRESITRKIYRTVRGQVKNYSPLKKEGKQWAVMALIADHTSSVEVCFDSEVLSGFLGFTVQEFVQKKKLAKMDPQMNNELRLSLRKAQHEIQNLDALLKLELIPNQMPKIVGITQLTQKQKEDLMKRSA